MTEPQIWDATVWGPHYWFMIHTIAHSYPDFPNATTKRKYYDLIQNIPLFIPDGNMGNKFSQILDRYPLTPYLDNRDSFIRWTNFIHNKMNVLLGKEEYSLVESIATYKNNYKPKTVFLYETFKMRKQLFHLVFVLFLFFMIFILCK
jgi:hypothetical protein